MEYKNVIKIEGVWYVIDGVEAMVARYQNHKYTGHITIPSEVKYKKQVYPVVGIDSEAFAGCAFLRSLVLSDGLRYICRRAFSGCKRLVALTLPSSLQRIDEGALRETAIQSLSITADSYEQYIHSNISNLYKQSLPLFHHVEMSKHIIIRGVELSRFEIPNGTEQVGSALFQDCHNLVHIDIPDSVKHIGDCAFAGCNMLRKIDLPLHLSTLGSNVFARSGITQITLSSSLQEIRDNIYNGIIKINIHLHSLEQMFHNNTNVMIENAFPNIEKHLIYNGVELEELAIPDTIRFIPDKCFMYLRSLRTIYIPAGVEQIGKNILLGCTSLQSIKVDSGNKHYDSREDCHAIVRTKTNCLIETCACSTIVSSIRMIEERALSNCLTQSEIRLPEGIRKVDNKMFKGFANLQTIHLPSTIVSIGEEAFADCKQLERIILPESVERIGRDAFAGCKQLERIILPESVERIGRDAFRDCCRLQELCIPSLVKIVQDRLLQGCTSLRKVLLPDGLQRIGSDAFESCATLKEIHLPDSLKSIGSMAFYRCTSLKSITIPEGVDCIRMKTFAHCRMLQTVVLPNSLIAIRDEAFYACCSLRHINMTAQVNLGLAVFKDCPYLDL